jgi:hypothetical protein
MTSLRFLRPSRVLLASGLFLWGCQTALAQTLPVFPGATGYGTNTVAGRGTVGVAGSTTVYKVTLLTDSNPSVFGELRYGVETVTGPRVIVFEKSGVIELRRALKIRNNNPFITIAGQTAPAPGITLKNAGINVQSHDVLVQHIAIRPGKRPKGAAGSGWDNWEFLPPISNRKCILIDALTGSKTFNVVFDHVSVSWGTDENVTIDGYNAPVEDVTVSNSFIYEALRHAGHPDDATATNPLDGHSAGFYVLNDVRRVSVARNVLAFNRWRNPRIAQGATDVRVANNFIYSPGEDRGHRLLLGTGGTPPLRASMDGNLVVLHQSPTTYGYSANATHGIAINNGAPVFDLFLNNNRLWHPTYSGNWVPSTPPFNSTLVSQGTPASPLTSDPLTDGVVLLPASLTTDQMEDALLWGSGARAGVRDLSDARLKTQIDVRTLRDWTDSPNQFPAAGLDAEGYPTASNTVALNPPSPAVAQDDPDGNGYTELEEWLHAFSGYVESGGGDPIEPSIPVLDNFEDNLPDGWRPAGVSNWSIAQVGTPGTPEHNRVYVQSDSSGDARSVLSGTNWTRQTVQADVKPTAFNGSDRWFGVFGRYRDTSNHYYLILRESGIVDLKKIVGGTATSLLVAPSSYTVVAGATYRLKLTLNGTALTGTVSTWNAGTNTWTNVVTVNATDSSIASGRAAIGMYKATAEYNNVLASPNVTPTNLLVDDFQDGNSTGWTPTGGAWSVVSSGGSSFVYRQTTSTGSFHSLAGNLAWSDQIVEFDAKANSFANTNRFLGIVARHTDVNNYYYFILRSNNTIELKKYVGGVQAPLDSASFPVSTSSNYRLRLDAIGSTLNAYINGRLVLEAQDASNATGQAGAKVYDAVAEFDNMLVTRP